jgi:hypothetical protein
LLPVAPNNVSFQVFSNLDLKTRCNNTWQGQFFSPTNPQSVNDIIGNSDFRMQVYNKTNFFEGGSFNAVPHHTINILCPQLGTFKSLGPQWERNILKKHVVQAGPQEISIDTYLNAEDFTNISKQTFKNLNFKLTDVYGNTLDLHGLNWSFTLIFQPIA